MAALSAPALPPRVRQRSGKDQHAAGHRVGCRLFTLHQPYPHWIQRRFEQQDGGGLKGRHVPDGAGYKQIGQPDLKYAEIEEHAEIE